MNPMIIFIIINRPKLRFRRLANPALTAYSLPPFGFKPHIWQNTAFCLLTRWPLLAIAGHFRMARWLGIWDGGIPFHPPKLESVVATLYGDACQSVAEE